MYFNNSEALFFTDSYFLRLLFSMCINAMLCNHLYFIIYYQCIAWISYFIEISAMSKDSDPTS